MASKKVVRRRDDGSFETVEVELTEEELAKNAVAMEVGALRKARVAVLNAIEKTALGYAQGRESLFLVYDDVRHAVIAAHLVKAPVAMLSDDASAIVDIYEYAEAKKLWASARTRTLAELTSYDPVLDNAFPS